MQPVTLGPPHQGAVIDACSICAGAFFDFEDGTPALLAKQVCSSEAIRVTSEAEDNLVGGCAACATPLVPHNTVGGVFRCELCFGVYCTRVGLVELAQHASLLSRPTATLVDQVVAFLTALVER